MKHVAPHLLCIAALACGSPSVTRYLSGRLSASTGPTSPCDVRVETPEGSFTGSLRGVPCGVQVGAGVDLELDGQRILNLSPSIP